MTTRLLLGIGLLALIFPPARAEDTVGKPISPWRPGTLDIHQISSGRGNALALGAEEFSLSAVKLLDGPFRQAMETDRAYLLRLDPDRLLAGFRREAGLPKKADPYGGWETIPDTGRYSLAGQALGHYLSALSLMASATYDAERRNDAPTSGK